MLQLYIFDILASIRSMVMVVHGVGCWLGRLARLLVCHPQQGSQEAQPWDVAGKVLLTPTTTYLRRQWRHKARAVS